MKCYIYKIINLITNEKYVGQTTNYNRRKENHLSALRNNRHPNPKLQNSWNYYGEENFAWEVKTYDLTKSELDQLEINTIKQENSYSNGFNLTIGGTGGNTRFKRIINFEQFCFIYAGNTHYKGMMGSTARNIGCDSSTISAIARDKSYDDYREAYFNLPKEEQNKYLQLFIETFQLNQKQPPKISSRLKDEQVVDFLCLISRFGKGAEVAFLRSVNHAKGLGHELKINPNYFRKSKEIYNSLTDNKIYERAELVYNKYSIQEQLTYKLADKKVITRVNCAL